MFEERPRPWSSSPGPRRASEPPWPTVRHPDYGVVPDLARIDRAAWPPALALIPERQAQQVLFGTTSVETTAGLTLLGEAILLRFEIANATRAAASRDPVSPAPGPVQPPRAARRAGFRQLNMRLRLRDYETLARAARLLDQRPTALARTFVLNGARRVVWEHQRAAGYPRTPAPERPG